MRTEADILYQTGRYWVTTEPRGRRGNPYHVVYRVVDSYTHSVRVASYGATLPGALARACDEADRRALEAP